MMVVFLSIIILIAFGIEEIFHEQAETNKRIKENLQKIACSVNTNKHPKVI